MELIIDADTLVYRGAFSAERTYYRYTDIDQRIHSFDTMTQFKAYAKDNGIKTGEGVLKQFRGLKGEGIARHYTKLCVQTILDSYPDLPYKLFLSNTDKQDYRFKAAKTLPYKGKRPPKPHYYQTCRDYLIENWNPTIVKGSEADDALGIIGTELKGECILVHIDKDIDQIPGIHYNPNKGLEYTISALDANRNLYKQLMCGDSVDNIPGIKHWCKPRTCGPKTVDKLLADCTNIKEMLGKITEHYMLNRLSSKDDLNMIIEEQMLLLRLCRTREELKENIKRFKNE